VNEHYHALIWIDHHQARIFQFNEQESDRITVHSSHPHEHLHHKANTRDSGHTSVDHAFLERVAQAVMQAGAILVTGPSSAKQELAKHIELRHPELFRRISAVETLDHPSDGEMLALARKFFRADDRMRSQTHS
jgi:stalled ribosome rescue protein Dom34